MLLNLIWLVSICIATVSAIPIDDYVNRVEPVYKWEHLKNATFTSALGNTVHVLNVTSLEWLDVSRARGVNGALWTHLVYVVVPYRLTHTNVSLALLTGWGNEKPNYVHGRFEDQDLLWVDEIAQSSESITIAVE